MKAKTWKEAILITLKEHEEPIGYKEIVDYIIENNIYKYIKDNINYLSIAGILSEMYKDNMIDRVKIENVRYGTSYYYFSKDKDIKENDNGTEENQEVEENQDALEALVFLQKNHIGVLREVIDVLERRLKEQECRWEFELFGFTFCINRKKYE